MTAPLKPGTRIQLVSMEGDPDPIPAGTKVTIRGSSEHRFGRVFWHQIDVDWDNGRHLMLVSSADRFEVLTRSERDEKI